MSILNYFKRFTKELSGNSPKENLQLPDPHGPLCTSVVSVPLSAVEAANGQVSISVRVSVIATV